jgi:colanic acid biosynthesis glycosyl transferase WcaI
MGILILSLNYAPEPTGFAPHTSALAEHLASRGDTVTVITGFPFAPRWTRWPEYRRRFISRQSINQVRVVRVSHFIPRRPGSALQRILMEGSFAATAMLAVLLRSLTAPPVDAVIYVGAQPAIAWLARVLAALHRAPYVVKITDLAAQAAVDVGIARSSP